jgi:hypothetical protein
MSRWPLGRGAAVLLVGLLAAAVATMVKADSGPLSKYREPSFVVNSSLQHSAVS